MASPVRVMKFHLFNCDNTYSLDSVETLLLKMADDRNLRLLVDKRKFRLHEMTDVCGKTIPMLQMDYAVFVVHAHESRLSINEDNAGIGYAEIYKTLLRATGTVGRLTLGTFSKPRRRRQRVGGETKDLMSRTIAQLVHFRTLYIS